MNLNRVLLLAVIFAGLLAQAQTSVTLIPQARIGQGHFSNRLPYEIKDPEIYSPKSARFSADGKKFYINSLEGGKTVIYTWPGLKKLKSISHRFTAKNANLFFGESTLFNYQYLTAPPLGDPNQFTVTEAGFTIKTESGMDRIGPLNIVTISRDGKRTRRKTRRYEEALEACARARGLMD